MGSIGNPTNTNWPPYTGYRDCSQGICSIYCPQWCYIIFPPPPPFQFDNDDSGMNFSPLIIVVIGILASVFLLVSYYTIISKYCKRRSNQLIPNLESENRSSDTILQHVTTGLDESLIKSIAVCKFIKGDGVVQGSDCAVCLSEFEEGESLRLLPKCNHAFHIPCIDTWLKSHSNCPLCRSHVMPGIPIPFQRPLESHIISSDFNVSSHVSYPRNDIVVVNVVTNENLQPYPADFCPNINGTRIPMNMGIGIPMNIGIGDGMEVRRSMSCQNPNLLIADILRNEDDFEDHQHYSQVGPSKGENSKSTRRSSMKRSVSTGRFMFTRNIDKGKNFIIPN